ncbi:expressed unknown protein [Seminavis robusta]|uniref:Uncharacterized protein n=1 Tax=Seminavis robusta TaxID=568900 RepID=A0A9N8D9A8_9STRA|nr:expressed unknown protein [Seminavis robusta]|eukprot:Sro45_g027040.1 n/a (185) ;mRNA; f:97839-98393
MMPRSLLVTALMLTSSAHAFVMFPLFAVRTPTTTSVSSSSDSSNNEKNNQSYPPEFHRAVECAKNQGMCNVDELLTLAQELEDYDDSCLWEIPMNGDSSKDDDEDCETEFLDRLDIADLLRAEREMMQRRENALEFSNLFREKIEQDELSKEQHDEDEECPPKEVIDTYSKYYETVYSQTGCGP